MLDVQALRVQKGEPKRMALDLLFQEGLLVPGQRRATRNEKRMRGVGMKAISLWQPWASLIATRAKTIETRSWATKYRGPLVICAAKGGLPIGELIHQLCLRSIDCGLAPLVGEPLGTYTGGKVQIEQLPFGKAVAIVNLIGCKRTGDMIWEEVCPQDDYGDFSLGRYAWILDDICRIKEPFPVKGRQGLFEVDIEEGSLP